MENKKEEITETGLQQRAQNALEYVRALEVIDQDSLTVANKAIVRIKITKKEIIGFFEEAKSAALATHRAILKKEKLLLEPVLEAEQVLNPKIRNYLEAERRKREAAEREAAIKEAADKRRADEAMAKAAALEQEGKVDEALDALDEATEIEETREKAVIPETPKVEGMSTTRRWKGTVIDEAKVPREYLTVDQTKINAAIKLGIREIPGVRIFQDVSLSVRTG